MTIDKGPKFGSNLNIPHSQVLTMLNTYWYILSNDIIQMMHSFLFYSKPFFCFVPKSSSLELKHPILVLRLNWLKPVFDIQAVCVFVKFGACWHANVQVA